MNTETILMKKRRATRLYNVVFPVWMLLIFPGTWLFVLPCNFIIDSIVLVVALRLLKSDTLLPLYKKTILKVFIFGLISDFFGFLFMLLMLVTGVSETAEELYLTIPAIILSALLIFISDYFISFKAFEKQKRLKLSLIFAVLTAPYTFLIPTSWIY